MNVFKKWGKGLLSGIASLSKATDKVEDVIEKIDSVVDAAHDAVDEKLDGASQAMADIQAKFDEVSANLAVLGTIQLVQLTQVQFDCILRGHSKKPDSVCDKLHSLTEIATKPGGMSSPLMVHYYDGPKLVCMRTRMASHQYYFKAVYNKDIL